MRRYHNWSHVIHVLWDLTRLRDDWDGQGAAAPSDGVIKAAVDLAQKLGRDPENEPPASALATPAGGVHFAWHDDPYYLEIEVISPTLIEWMEVGRDGVIRHGDFERQAIRPGRSGRRDAGIPPPWVAT